MGCWFHTCSLTNLPIYPGMPIVALPVLVDGGLCSPAGMPIPGTYNDYGMVEDEELAASPQWDWWLGAMKEHIFRSVRQGMKYDFHSSVSRRVGKGQDRFEAALEVMRENKPRNYHRSKAKEVLGQMRGKDIVGVWEELRCGGLRVREVIQYGKEPEYHYLDFLLFHKSAWDAMLKFGKDYLLGMPYGDTPAMVQAAIEGGLGAFEGVTEDVPGRYERLKEIFPEMTRREYLIKWCSADMSPLLWPWNSSWGGCSPFHRHIGWSLVIREKIMDGALEKDPIWHQGALDLMFLQAGMMQHRMTLHIPSGIGSQEPLAETADAWIDAQKGVVDLLKRHWEDEDD